MGAHDKACATNVFRFLHLFDGETDGLGEALVQVGAERGLEVHVDACNLSQWVDASDWKVFTDLRSKASKGYYQGGHSTFPCTSFNHLCWRSAPSSPRPVRSRDWVYGLPSNTISQQAEADRDTLFACQSLEILTLIEGMPVPGTEVWPTTIANPPPTDHPFAASAFELPEVAIWTDRPSMEHADFNTCRYADSTRGEDKHKTPQRFVGKLRGLAQLSATCNCPPSFTHPQVPGQEASCKSAVYPRAFCWAYALLVTDVWVRLRHLHQPTAATLPEADWDGGRGQHGALRNLQSKRLERDAENKQAVGGLRRPAWAIERAPGVRSVGQEVSKLFDKFAEKFPGAATAAANYGTDGFELHYVTEWQTTLRAYFGLALEPKTPPTPKLAYKSPVDVELLKAWTERARDPETAVPAWLQYGAPLGAKQEIPTCGIFPLRQDDVEGTEESVAEAKAYALAKGNYSSYSANPDDAKLEMDRLESKGFVRKVTIQDAEREFKTAAVSRMGLIIKEKPQGKKRRVIVDARRSGANSLASCPERIVLPRPQDVHDTLADMKQAEADLKTWYTAQGESQAEWGAEFVAADLTDAFTHYPVAPDELGQCLSPAGDGLHMYVFVALFFGHKSAPLLMCRLSALLSRLIQGLHWPAELQLSTYVDDPLFMLVGSRSRRNRNLSLTLSTLAAWGIQMAWHKGSRGSCLVWIGVQFNLRWREGVVRTEVPEKLRLEIHAELAKWKHRGMVSETELRSMAGKLTWAVSIYKRARWAVAMIYAALSSHVAEVKDGAEAFRRQHRQDKRPKDHLVAVKRFELARSWLQQLFNRKVLATSRTLWSQTPTLLFITDASPQGCGAVLLVRSSAKTNWTLYQAMEYPVDATDAALLRFELGSHKSQAYLEGLAMFLALRQWGPLLFGIPVDIAFKSDSTVALSLLQKSCSASPALNLLAAEMALQLETLQVGQLNLTHLPGKLNIVADFLSRPQTRGPSPPALQDVKVLRPSKLKASDFRLGAPGSHDAAPAGAAWAALTG